ncbi:MAG: hypothetical protein UT13_C0001G0840 [Candidatus Pacebacteria bacterium GW2011_GWF2_38_9]|nr:MAG: hypothetical protein US01_C0001G0878 [candidate division TM6 bacterium GW2011_GWF2_28_16]KKQ08580.1 MAG: hypothetical protein US20_C0014G0011 [Candidatus Pacebacteria bacterium GW2011_GWF1_36_5]KKQ89192.1 MAG: hypothetical protein UT13_C0001G0840 [Candidatus Pacebacteria bacterium GW2011_GWF2_38_9]HAZ73763.1 hypothetical protein [Candidatus Paceibacterota bacterium]
MKILNIKQKIALIVLSLAFITGLLLSIFIFNKQQRQIENHFEVTFVDPHQAIIFWTSEKESIGFAKYGESETNLSQVAQQTSSVPGTIHAVLLTDIPADGFYLSLHTDKDSPFLWSEVKKINFDPTKIE